MPVPTTAPARAAAPPSARLYVPGTEGLRVIAAIGIVVFHTYMTMRWFPRGSDASAVHDLLDRAVRMTSIRVDVFFVLSAFLLSLPLVRRLLVAEAMPSWSAYARRRFWRIMPLYLFLLGISAATQLRSVTSHEQLLLNATFLWPWFEDGTRLMIPSWTLAIEVGFYVALPVLVVAAGLLARRLRNAESRALLIAAVLLVPLAIGPAIRAGVIAPSPPIWHDQTVLHRFDAFAIGMYAALLVALLWHRGRLVARRPGANTVAVALVAAGFAVLGTRLQHARLFDGSTASPLEHTYKAIAIAVLLVAFARGLRLGGAVALLDSAPMRWLGERSYGIFLWHCIVLSYLAAGGLLLTSGVVGLAVNVLVALAISTLLATITWHYIERPYAERGRG